MESIRKDYINQAIKEYQPLFVFRLRDKTYLDAKRKKGVLNCYLTEDGNLIPFEGEKILKTFKNVSLNVKDDSFKSQFKKMRVAKRAPNHWTLYLTSERIVAVIPYKKTLKIGDIVDLFKTTIKRVSHKDEFIVAHLPHSMLAGIVLRMRENKRTCDHIAFIYKNKLIPKKMIVNYTLYFFNYGPHKISEKFCLKVKNIAVNLQKGLLPLMKNMTLLSPTELSKINSEITQSLSQNKFKTEILRDKLRDVTIKTLFTGGIPFPIFPRITSKSLGITFKKGYRSQ